MAARGLRTPVCTDEIQSQREQSANLNPAVGGVGFIALSKSAKIKRAGWLFLFLVGHRGLEPRTDRL